jgi:hypothetical protein
MEFKYIINKNDLRRFIDFGQIVYKDNLYYRDSMSDIIKMFLYGKTSYLQHGDVLPFIIEERGEILLRAAFVIDQKLPGTLMVSFFEALPGIEDAVGLMLDQGKELASTKGLQKIIIGLDAHLNYGVGFLASHFDQTPCFGFSYTLDYYLDYFRNLKEYNFTSILADVNQFNLDKEQRILERIKNKGFSFRLADFKKLEREIGIFTSLNNVSFQNHLWWSERTFLEDKELLFPFRWFIKEENLIIAEKDGEPIGLLLWYPDFNQLIAPGHGLGLTTLLKRLGGAKGIDKFKIADLVIKPEYQGMGVVLGLFEILYSCVKDKYKYFEAGWIEENNYRSKAFGIRWQDMGLKEYKKYKAFEVLL